MAMALPAQGDAADSSAEYESVLQNAKRKLLRGEVLAAETAFEALIDGVPSQTLAQWCPLVDAVLLGQNLSLGGREGSRGRRRG